LNLHILSIGVRLKQPGCDLGDDFFGFGEVCVVSGKSLLEYRK
jgi:hypothetical protein